ncbi:TolC family protein [Chryseobacterium sp. NFX27]|uniref:TolC family protein n=1 Tax=Chryseobacterium sp. NFX27 TaxID=2819618 RepID=UPI003CE94D10
MSKKIILLSVVPFVLSSCLMYKDATKERTDELKKKSLIAQHINIPEEWIMDKNADEKSLDFQWINSLYDSELAMLVEEGLQYNADIIIAQEKLNQIELAMSIAGANLYPAINAVTNTSNNLINGTKIQNLGVQANWELDLWGKNKSNQMASVSDYFSVKYKNEKIKQTIASMIAKAYFLNIAGHLQEQKIHDYLKLTQGLEKLYSIKSDIGTANDIDLSNIKAELISVSNYLEKINNANAQSRRTLELLIGKYPEGKIRTKTKFNPITASVPKTFPLPLIENRPDILAQQYQIEKSFYEVQEAKAARMPSLSISSTLGTANTNISAINSLYSNPLIKVGGGLMTPLFNGGKLKKNVEIRDSEQRQAVEEYSKTVLNALNEIESSWANVLSLEKQLTYNQEVITELTKNINLTKKQIKIGTNNNFELILKQRSLLKKEMNIIDLELQERIERINLYLALGAPKYK